ncbi:MAG: hypothetical protein AB7L13_04810 [Acidimicrobiia bacterium]
MGSKGTVEHHGRFAESHGTLVSYRYLGCGSEMLDKDHAVGHMPLRSDMRFSSGVMGAPLAIAMLDTAGINIDRIRFAAPTHIALQIMSDGVGVKTVRTDGTVNRIARTALFTECTQVDADNPDTVIATGNVDWASMGDVAPGFEYQHPGPGVPDEPLMPPLFTAYTIEHDDMNRYVIPALNNLVGPSVLHHGPQLVALECQANDLAEREGGSSPLRLQTYDVRLLRGGKRPPFVTVPLGSGRAGQLVWARSALVDDDGNGDVIAQASLVYRA